MPLLKLCVLFSLNKTPESLCFSHISCNYIPLLIQTRTSPGNAGTFLQLEPGAGTDPKRTLSEPHFLKEGAVVLWWST